MIIKQLFNYLSERWRNFRKNIEISKYTEDTIAEYFRKHGAKIGENCRIQNRWLASELYLVNLGNHVCIASGAILHTHDGGVWVLKEKYGQFDNFGPITIEDNCIIGVNAQVLPNVTIGRNSIIGAGSVVITDIPPNSIAMGIPARVIGSVSKYEEKCAARWKEQRPPDLIIEEGCDDYYRDKRNKEAVKKRLISLLNDRDKEKEKNEKAV